MDEKQHYFGFMDNGGLVYAGEFEDFSEADAALNSQRQSTCVWIFDQESLAQFMSSAILAVGHAVSSPVAWIEYEHRHHVAYAAGVKAAHEGRQRAPATDRTYMELVEARPRPVGEGDAAELAQEWLAGYDYISSRGQQ